MNNNEINEYKQLAILCYIPFFSLYLLFTSKYKESQYLLFHTNQGLIITILSICSFFIVKMINAININNTGILSFICYLIYFILFLLILFGIINTANDKTIRLPFTDKINLLK